MTHGPSKYPPTPFSRLYSAVWDLFCADPVFNNLIPEGNRIRYDSDTNRDPDKTSETTADTPRFELTQGGGAVNLNNTSDTSMIKQTFSAIVITGDQRINAYANIIQWMIVCNIKKWKQNLSSLKWCGLPYVKVVRVTEAAIGFAAANKPNAAKGWNAVWTIEVEMHFSTNQQLVFTETSAE